MKTAISIPDPVFQKAEQIAEDLGVSRSKLYTVALNEFIQMHESEGITKTLDKVYASEHSLLDDSLAKLQYDSLAEDQW